MPDACGGQGRALDPLELELNMVVQQFDHCSQVKEKRDVGTRN